MDLRKRLAYLYKIQPRSDLRPGSRSGGKADTLDIVRGIIGGFLAFAYTSFLLEIYNDNALMYLRSWKIILPLSLALVILLIIFFALPRAWINVILGMMMVLLMWLVNIMIVEGGARYYGVANNDYHDIVYVAGGMYVGFFIYLLLFIIAMIAVLSKAFKSIKGPGN